MKLSTLQKLFLPIVEQFVEGERQRYKEHVSDTLLVLLIMERLNMTYPMRHAEGERKTYADLIAEGDQSAAYEAVVPLFERILEHGCSVICNGHHVAQRFNEAASVLHHTKEEEQLCQTTQQ